MGFPGVILSYFSGVHMGVYKWFLGPPCIQRIQTSKVIGGPISPWYNLESTKEISKEITHPNCPNPTLYNFELILWIFALVLQIPCEARCLGNLSNTCRSDWSRRVWFIVFWDSAAQRDVTVGRVVFFSTQPFPIFERYRNPQNKSVCVIF